VKLEKDGWDVLWCQGAQNIELSNPNHKIKSALKCTIWSHCTPVPDTRTDRRTNNMAIARRFVLMNPSRAEREALFGSQCKHCRSKH